MAGHWLRCYCRMNDPSRTKHAKIRPIVCINYVRGIVIGLYSALQQVKFFLNNWFCRILCERWRKQNMMNGEAVE